MQKKVIKVLIIRFSSIGDIVWTSLVVRTLKRQLENVEIHFCTKEKYQGIVQANPYIDRCHYLKDQKNHLKNVLKTLQKEKFDYVIDLHRNLRSKYLKFFLRTKSFTYKKRTWQRWLLVKFKINTLNQSHIADWYMETVAPLGVKNDGQGLDYFLEESDRVQPNELPLSHQSGFVALVIGASRFTKKLPPHRLVALCKQINRPIVLIGGPEDQEVAQIIEEHFQTEPFESVNIYNLCGKASIHKSAAFIAEADIVFGHDTGLTHIAAAFKKKIFAIYGGTLSQYLHPYTDDHTLLENNNLSCRPCSKVGRHNCPKGHFKCMEDIPFNFQLDHVIEEKKRLDKK